jgi:acetolactate synthase-1/2/3 large subunit
MRHGGKILIDQLEIQGVTTVFTVPGESFLAALDGLHDSNQIRTVICRQEGGAAMMAEGWGKMTGEPGVCFVTRGPGAANAMSGLHVAQQDSTPMVLFVGLPGAGHEDREAFQEIETKSLFSSFVKWAAVIRSTERIPEYVSRAFHVAVSGRPGPVVLGLPEDMLSAMAEAKDARRAIKPEPAPSPATMSAFAELLSSARRPLMVVGGPGWSVAVQRKIEEFASRFDLPVAAAFRFQDYIDNSHPCYAGHAGIGIEGKLRAAVADADLLIVLGARLGEMTTSGYTLLDIPNPSQRLVHIYPSSDELGRVFAPVLPITATVATFADALLGLKPPASVPWSSRRAQLHEAFQAWNRPIATPGDVKLEEIIRIVSERLPDNGIVTSGAGNYTTFLHRYFKYKGYRTQLSPTSGSMGYGLPAAIAAKLAEPSRAVVAFAGDGCFQMTGLELGTAMQYGLALVVIVANNGMFGTIRMHQEREYPARVVGTTLVNPDFAALAASFGAHGETVRRTEEFAPAFERALAARRPALIELKTDPEAITTRQTLSEIRATGVGQR